jgi:hypothetical protein
MEKISHILLLTSFLLGFTACGDEAKEPTEKSNIQKEDKTQVATTAEEQMAQMGEALIKGQEKIIANPNMSQEEQEEVIVNAIANSEGMKSQLQKIKNGMPKMLEAMKFGKECLNKAENKEEAKTCMNKVNTMVQESGMSEVEDDAEEDFSWSAEDKKAMLKDIDDAMNEMEKSLPCIEKANTMMDLMQCQKY